MRNVVRFGGLLMCASLLAACGGSDAPVAPVASPSLLPVPAVESSIRPSSNGTAAASPEASAAQSGSASASPTASPAATAKPPASTPPPPGSTTTTSTGAPQPLPPSATPQATVTQAPPADPKRPETAIIAGPPAETDCQDQPTYTLVVTKGKPAVGGTVSIKTTDTIYLRVQSDTAGKFGIGGKGWEVPMEANKTISMCFKAKPGSWPAFWNATKVVTLNVTK